MFGLPIEEIKFQDIESFCRSGVRESVILDFKKDFPAKLEKTIAAFANTFGGIILIGVDETALGEPIVPISGVPLAAGLRERVVQIGLDAIYPPVIPEIKVVDFKSTDALNESDRAVIVVRVHESETGGHAVDKRTTVYLRVENVSDPFRRVTLDELEWFINKREKAIKEKDRILDLARNHAGQYLLRLRTRREMSTNEPAAKVLLWTVPRFPREPLASPQELLRLAHEFRWPLEHHRQLFPLGSILPVREGICFDGDYDSRYRYTEIHQQGLLYHEWGFWWDGEPRWRQIVFPSSIAELLLASLRLACLFYARTDYLGLLEFQLSLVGVQGRMFYDPVPTGFPPIGYGATDDQIGAGETTSVSELIENGIELAGRAMADIAWAFGDQNCPRTVEKILAKAKADGMFQPPLKGGFKI